MRSRIGAWRTASPAPATAPRSRASSTTRCAGAASAAYVMGERGAARDRARHAAARAQARCWPRSRSLADGARFAPAPLSDGGARAARGGRVSTARRRGSPATIRNGSTRISRACSARSARPRVRRSRAARRSICASTRSRPTATRPWPRSRDLDPQPTRWSPLGLRIALAADAKSPAIHAEPAFIKGLVEVQDEGSQLAALLAGAKPGEQVVDLCAGAGGKTLALAAAMENHGPDLRDRSRQAPARADP